jgi:hypothetical protein
MIMSTRISLLTRASDDGPEADGSMMPRGVDVMCIVGLVYVTSPARTDQFPAGSPVGSPQTRPTGVEPEVYCKMRAGEYAAQGFAPCTALGCAGCK